jgi:hemoglobin
MRHRSLVLLGAVVLAGCMEGAKQAPLDRKPLYSRLGGQVKIAPLVEGLIARVADDERLPDRLREPFQGGGTSELRQKLLAKIQEVSSSGTRFSPDQQRQAVRRLGLTDTEYADLREDFAGVLAEHQVGRAEREELLEMLAPVLADVLERSD